MLNICLAYAERRRILGKFAYTDFSLWFNFQRLKAFAY